MASPNPLTTLRSPAPPNFLVPDVELLAKVQKLLVQFVLVRHSQVVVPVPSCYDPSVASVAVVGVVYPPLARVVVSPPSPLDVLPTAVEANEEEVVCFILRLIKFCSCCINYFFIIFVGFLLCSNHS